MILDHMDLSLVESLPSVVAAHQGTGAQLGHALSSYLPLRPIMRLMGEFFVSLNYKRLLALL